MNIYEIRPTLKYAIRLRATSRENAIAKWRKRGSRDLQGNLTEEANLLLRLLDGNADRTDYEPTVELIEETP